MAKMFLDVFNLSITASWLIVAVILVRLVIRHRAPKWVTCLLWTMVGIRLVIPFSLESAVSLIPSRETIIPESVYGETVVQTPDITPPEQDNPDAGIDTPNEDIGTPNEGIDVPDEYIPPAIENIPEEYIHSGIGAIDDRVNPIIQSTATIENGKSKNILQTVTFAASCVWILGMVSLVIYAAINYLLLKKRIATSVPEGKDIRKSEAVGSPFILGVFRPRIYMPFGLSKATEEHVLAHERAHLKRGDHLIKPIGYAILTVHWFNPLVWLGYILLCRDIEYACDEKVVKNMSAEARKAYAEALLECGVSKSRISACPVAFGETGVKKRVKNTLNYKKPLFWVMIAAIIICTAVAVLFLTSPAAEKETSDTSDVSDVVDVSNVSDVIDESDVSLPPEEVSKPEESNPEESKPEPTQEEIRTLYESDIAQLEEKLKQGYSAEYKTTGYEHIVKYYSADNSMYVKSGHSEYHYYDNGIYVCTPHNTYTSVSIENADFEVFADWTKSIVDNVNGARESMLQQILETESDITFEKIYSARQYSATCDYLHWDKYEGFVKITVLITDAEAHITADYTYKETYNGETKSRSFKETYSVEFQTESVKEPHKNKVDKAYEFKSYDEYEAFAEKLYEFYESAYKLGKNSLNKAIYSNYKGTDSMGSDCYINEKSVAVGTNDDFILAKAVNFYRPPSELYKFDTYTYITENSYDYRRIWEGINIHNRDLPQGSIITGEDVESEPRDQLYSDRFAYAYYGDEFFIDTAEYAWQLTATDIDWFINIAGRFDKITYTSNDDGTITVDFTCVGREWITYLLFGTPYQINGHWLDEDNVYDHIAKLTYDPETGMMTSLSIDCTATRDGFWYKHEFDLTVTDADESMLPEKAELLAGNW